MEDVPSPFCTLCTCTFVRRIVRSSTKEFLGSPINKGENWSSKSTLLKICKTKIRKGILIILS